jgi:cytoskeletal protein CcmA (bactofilin family)
METSKAAEFAHIGKSVIIKGELSGSEDLYVDGVVEGNIELQGNNLTIGPNGKVRANVNAKGVVIQGRLEGNIRASERIELRSTAVAVGDISTQRVAIEEGAYLKGKVDIQREGTKATAAAVSKPAESKPEAKIAAASAPSTTAKASGVGASSSPSSTTVTKP